MPSLKSSLVAVTLGLGIANAHTMVFISDERYQEEFGNRPIRNAKSSIQNGWYASTSPCGGKGVMLWGENGYSQIRVGDWIYMKTQWNGGHKQEWNFFVAFWGCDEPSEWELARECSNNFWTERSNMVEGVVDPVHGECGSKLNYFQMDYDETKPEGERWSGECEILHCPDVDIPPVAEGERLREWRKSEGIAFPYTYCNAEAGNTFDGGYVMRCKIPKEMKGRKCTAGLQDYKREWGGCYDIEVLKEGATLTKQKGPADWKVNLGMYHIDQGVKIENRPATDTPCCELTYGNFTVEEHGSEEFDLGATAMGEGYCPGFCPSLSNYYCKRAMGCIADGPQGLCHQEYKDGFFQMGERTSWNKDRYCCLFPIKLEFTKIGDGIYEDEIRFGGPDRLKVTLADGQIMLTNMETEEPRICDYVFKKESDDFPRVDSMETRRSNQNQQSSAAVEEEEEGSDTGAIVGISFGIVIAFCITAGVAYKVYGNKQVEGEGTAM